MKREDIELPVENQQLSFLELPLPETARFIKNSSPEDIFPDFKKGYSAFGMNNGSFSFGDVIEYVLNHTGPAHAMISSWVASQAASEKVVDWLGNRRILSARFLLDRMFTETRRKVYDFIVRKFGLDSIRTSRIHTKFCVLHNEDWFVVIETSANLNKNTRLEIFRITEDKAFCMFFKEMFDNFFNIISPKENGLLAAAQKLGELPDIPDTGKTGLPDKSLAGIKLENPVLDDDLAGLMAKLDANIEKMDETTGF